MFKKAHYFLVNTHKKNNFWNIFLTKKVVVGTQDTKNLKENKEKERDLKK